jgi:type VI secretion system protein ImpI
MPLRLHVVSANASALGEEQICTFAACGGTIGRALDNDWVLPDAKRFVSGRHALIDYQSGAYYLVDVSRNGVYVNGANAPVGRGHPQRLFDGDRLALGDFEITVEITETDEERADDGMRDSVVRAQLVTEDDSVELQLMDERQLVEADALERHLAAGDPSVQLSQLSEILPSVGAVAAPADGANAAVAELLKAAGLKPADVAGVAPTEVLRTAGRLLQFMVHGVMDLLQERARVKETFRLSQTIIRREQNNNPLKFSPGVPEALKFLLGDRSEGYMSADQAIQASFQDIKCHEEAVMTAMLQALQDYIERFDPDELRSGFDRSLKRGSLLAGANKLRYWELYQESYETLTRHEEGTLPAAFSEDFARAYEQEVQARRAQVQARRA